MHTRKKCPTFQQVFRIVCGLGNDGASLGSLSGSGLHSHPQSDRDSHNFRLERKPDLEDVTSSSTLQRFRSNEHLSRAANFVTSLVDFTDDDVTRDDTHVASVRADRLKSQSVQNVTLLSHVSSASPPHTRRLEAPAKPMRAHHASHEHILLDSGVGETSGSDVMSGRDSLRRFHSLNSLAQTQVVQSLGNVDTSGRRDVTDNDYESLDGLTRPVVVVGGDGNGYNSRPSPEKIQQGLKIALYNQT